MVFYQTWIRHLKGLLLSQAAPIFLFSYCKQTWKCYPWLTDIVIRFLFTVEYNNCGYLQPSSRHTSVIMEDFLDEQCSIKFNWAVLSNKSLKLLWYFSPITLRTSLEVCFLRHFACVCHFYRCRMLQWQFTMHAKASVAWAVRLSLGSWLVFAVSRVHDNDILGVLIGQTAVFQCVSYF